MFRRCHSREPEGLRSVFRSVPDPGATCGNLIDGKEFRGQKEA